MSEFNIPKNNYLTFDAYTMKQYIRDRLNESDVFTDQNFEGSYLTTINNVVAYTFNSLMYYLNKTSSESMFSEAQIYENMNRIVKMLSYSPVGFQTATLPFTPTVGILDPDIYFIPRYSYFIDNNIAYSFAEDIVFEKTISASEQLDDLANQKLLFQGRFREYAVQTASGEDNEIITLNIPNNINVDHFNIFVYVYRDAQGVWEEWKRTESLYLERPTSSTYEVRLNENRDYEIKFGDNINGSKLLVNDRVAIYYIESQGVTGEVGPRFLESCDLVLFNSAQINNIMDNVRVSSATLLPNNTLFTATNQYQSSNSKNIETSDEIRENAPGIFRSQLRLVTKDDYSNFIRTNFSNFIHDVAVTNNWGFLSGRIQYLYDLGLENPLSDTPTLYTHSEFADACNFNNIYVTVCPKTSINSINLSPTLSNSQKQTIISTINSRKTLTSETIILDPVYMAADIGITGASSLSTDDIALTNLFIVKKPGSRRSEKDIKQDIVDVFKNTFMQSNRSLGDVINISEINNNILSIDGVERVQTLRTDTNSLTEGVSMILYNPIYPQDVSLITNNTDLLDFQFAYFNDLSTLSSRISIENQSKPFELVEY